MENTKENSEQCVCLYSIDFGHLIDLVNPIWHGEGNVNYLAEKKIELGLRPG